MTAIASVVMGSDSDWVVMQEAVQVLDFFEISHEVVVASAHRSPERTFAYGREAAERGLKVLIAGAGGAAHLAGVLASATTLPVIGVPIDSSPLQGLDALLATVQMPAGVPVATMAIGKNGARNAGILAAQIIALSDPALAERLRAYRAQLAAEVEKTSEGLAAHVRRL